MLQGLALGRFWVKETWDNPFVGLELLRRLVMKATLPNGYNNGSNNAGQGEKHAHESYWQAFISAGRYAGFPI